MGSKHLSYNDFVERSNAIHEGKYDYTKALFTTVLVKVEIICPIHGSFWQKPRNHIISKQGCPKCGGTGKVDPEAFIRRFEERHDKRYDYNKAVFANARTKIEIICSEHGSFWQAPYAHLKQGCAACNGNRLSDTPSFIKKADTIHEEKYDYSKSVYVNARTPIEIICPIHGSFWQKPNWHLTDRGCSKCSRSISKMEREWLKHIGIPDNEEHRQVKIVCQDKTYNVDGYDPATNTIYEFFGDRWHGNPKTKNQTEVIFERKNQITTYGDLYRKTEQKLADMKLAGYQIVYIWEYDWITLKSSK